MGEVRIEGEKCSEVGVGIKIDGAEAAGGFAEVNGDVTRLGCEEGAVLGSLGFLKRAVGVGEDGTFGAPGAWDEKDVLSEQIEVAKEGRHGGKAKG